MSNESQACETPLEDLRAGALKHYDEVSSAAHSWHSIIPQAINFYFDRKQAEAEAQREPELITAEKGTSLREFIDKYGPAASRGTNWYKDLGDVLLEARSRPTVEAKRLQQFIDGDYQIIARHTNPLLDRDITADIKDHLNARSRPTVDENFSEKFWGIINEAIGDWGGSDKITTTRRAMYREAYDRISTVFTESGLSAQTPKQSVEAAEIRRQAFDEAIQVAKQQRIVIGPSRCAGYEERSSHNTGIDKVMSALEATRDAAPIPSENDSGIEATEG